MNINTLKISIIILSLGVIIGAFLPWSEVRSSAEIMGYQSSYHQSSAGVEHPYGKFTAILGGISLIMVFLSLRWVLIPGLMSLIITLMMVIGYGNISGTLNTAIGSAYAGAGIGVYISFISSIGLAIVGIQALMKPKIVLDINSEEFESAKIRDKEIWDATWKAIAVAFGIAIFIQGGGYCVGEILRYIDSNKTVDITTQTMEAHELITTTVTPENAFPKSAQEKEIQRLDSVENDFRKWQFPKEYPFPAMILSVNCILHAGPNSNSDKKMVVPQESNVTIMALKNYYFYCSYKTADGKSEAGWIYYRDVVR